VRLAVSVAALALAAVAVAGGASSSSSAAAPTGLRAFVLRPGEAVPADHTYAQLPAFAWTGVHGASSYELQLATSPSFVDATIVEDAKGLVVPAASLQVQVPWMTGSPYALWVHVRSVVDGRVSPWSKPFGFNTAWQQVPRQLPTPTGLVRWTPVDGATSYEVLFLDTPGHYTMKFTTLTNVADEREYWTFHPADAAVIHWRVRAVRTTQTAALRNGVPVTAYGPYSPVYTTRNAAAAAAAAGRLRGAAEVSDTASARAPHALTPGFAWTGTAGADGSVSNQGLYRAYVFSDRGCVNQVMAGSVVGSPAWAPRDVDPLALPGTAKDLDKAAAGGHLGFGPQGTAFSADASPLTPSESQPIGGAPAADAATAAGGTTGPSGSDIGNRDVTLPDNGWPQGRYWWTVVPVAAVEVVPENGTPGDSDAIEYHDLELPQDACAAGQVWSFGVQSQPVTTAAATPLVSGLVAGPRIVAAASRVPSFAQLPLITWRPALGAISYQVQLSRKLYPWNAARTTRAVVPSAVLPLTKHDVGTWYYRVRGVNPDLPQAAQAMAWSKPVAVRITGDRFVVLG
jgi:hypothetical protein